MRRGAETVGHALPQYPPLRLILILSVHPFSTKLLEVMHFPLRNHPRARAARGFVHLLLCVWLSVTFDTNSDCALVGGWGVATYSKPSPFAHSSRSPSANLPSFCVIDSWCSVPDVFICMWMCVCEYKTPPVLRQEYTC